MVFNVCQAVLGRCIHLTGFPKIWSAPQSSSKRTSIRIFLVYWMLCHEPSNIGLLAPLSQLVVLPYVVWIICIVAIVVTSLDPLSVSRKTFYCTIRRSGLTLVLEVYILICCSFACILDSTWYDTTLSPVSDTHRSSHRYRPSP